MPKRKLPPNDQVVAMYRSGMSSLEIGEQYGTQGDAVIRLLRRLGEPIRTAQEAAQLRETQGRRAITRPWAGKKVPREVVERRAEKIRGEKHWLWKGGSERRPYRNVVQKERCAGCGARLNLCIHHVDLDHQNNAPDNLMVMCVSCHLSFHKWLYWRAKRAGRETPKSTGWSHWEAWKKSQE